MQVALIQVFLIIFWIVPKGFAKRVLDVSALDLDISLGASNRAFFFENEIKKKSTFG